MTSLKTNSWVWFKTKTLKDKVSKLETELSVSKIITQTWKDYWFRQRDATGKAYWEGYKNGRELAIAWHARKAAARREASKTFLNEADKVAAHFDAVFHEWSAQNISQQGYNAMHKNKPKP